MKMSNPILPPSIIGILGSGQLGRMLALEARYAGYGVHVFSPRAEPTPTGMIADKAFTAPYDDLDAVRAFARGVNVVTYEFENVPAETAAACQEFAPLRPGAQALHVAQNRLREKQFFRDNGLPTTPFAPVNSLADLEAALAQIGAPAILKTATSGYDGKGQVRIDNRQSSIVNRQWEAIGQQPAILEGFVEFEREVSVVAARSVDGAFAHFGVIENDHVNHILDVSTAPANVPPSVAADAVEMARTVLEALDVVGVLCVEFFLTRDGRLLLNEIAPRPHNSGHLTIEACAASQFGQQLRAVCGLPLGDATYLRPAAMANLLGDLWGKGNQYKGTKEERNKEEERKESAESVDFQPDWSRVFQNPHVHLHLYAKGEARPGRKMGHLTALAHSAAEAKEAVLAVRKQLTGPM